MANSLFDAGRDAFLTGARNWVADDMRLMLVDHGTDTPDVNTDTSRADIAVGARVATTTATIANKTASGSGIANGDDVLITGVTGNSVESVDVFFFSNVAETSDTLIAFYDSAGSTLPFTPNGGDVTVVWDNGANLMFKL